MVYRNNTLTPTKSIPRHYSAQDHPIDTSLLQAAVLNDGVRFIHLLVVAIGLGASFFADSCVLRQLRAPVTQELIGILRRCHTVVWSAIALMWISGAALIYLRTGFVWDNVSPKLIDKVVVVSVLTFNAWAIGTVAMRQIERSLGKSVLALPRRIKLPMAIIGAVSTASWLLALALGSSAVLAQSSASLLFPLTVGSYGFCIVLSLCAALALKAEKYNQPDHAGLTNVK